MKLKAEYHFIKTKRYDVHLIHDDVNLIHRIEKIISFMHNRASLTRDRVRDWGLTDQYVCQGLTVWQDLLAYY